MKSATYPFFNEGQGQDLIEYPSLLALVVLASLANTAVAASQNYGK